MSELSRRSFALGGIAVVAGSCVQKKPETPLAHLYGQGWVKGAYTHYAQAHQRVESSAEQEGLAARQVLAMRGVAALHALQLREVPFWVRVSEDASGFRVERDVPERLTFTAGMSQEQRDEASRVWKQARDHIQRDYEEVRALDGALGKLLKSVGNVRHAVDAGRLEQFRLCRQLTTLEGGGKLPFELPYQVSAADYQMVLSLLLERLDTDAARLRRLEASLVATGLTARAADSGSLSLSQNLEKVLLAVERDAAAVDAASTVYPEGAERQRALATATKRRQEIMASPEYIAWLRAQQERLDVVGQFLRSSIRSRGCPHPLSTNKSCGYGEVTATTWDSWNWRLGSFQEPRGYVPRSSRLWTTARRLAVLQRPRRIWRSLRPTRNRMARQRSPTVG